MQNVDYLDFLADDDIRIKGTRIGIESVLYEYIYREKTAEEIIRQFPNLSLEQIYATILFYLENRVEIEVYMANWLLYSQEMRELQARVPPPIILKLQKMRTMNSGEPIPA